MSSPRDLFSFSHVKNSTRLETERILALQRATARERGLTGTVAEQLPMQNAMGTATSTSEPLRQRIGLGLPLSNIFATYFGKIQPTSTAGILISWTGGSLELVSLEGWGLDVYIRLPRLGTNLEEIEV